MSDPACHCDDCVREEMEALLRKHQFVDHAEWGGGFCPECAGCGYFFRPGVPVTGHKDGCAIGALIARLDSAKGTPP